MLRCTAVVQYKASGLVRKSLACIILKTIQYYLGLYHSIIFPHNQSYFQCKLSTKPQIMPSEKNVANTERLQNIFPDTFWLVHTLTTHNFTPNWKTE